MGDGARQHQDVHLAGSAGEQRPGTSLGGGPAGGDVVHEEHPPGGEQRTRSSTHDESAPHILAALGQTERGLSTGLPASLEQATSEGTTQQARQGPREQGSLVVAPLPQATGMQGDGHQQIDLGQPARPSDQRRRGEQGRERAGQLTASLILEAQQGVSERPAVEEGRAQGREGGRLMLTAGTKLEGLGFATARAGILGLEQTHLADRTKELRRTNHGRAGGAAGRQEQVDETGGQGPSRASRLTQSGKESHGAFSASLRDGCRKPPLLDGAATLTTLPAPW